MIASSIQTISKHSIFVMRAHYRVPIQGSLGWFHVEIHIAMCVFFGCDLSIQLLLKSLLIVYDDRLVDR